MEQDKRIKILIVSQYFWPENFRINDVADYFKGKDYEVTILTGKPNYPGGVLYEDFHKCIEQLLGKKVFTGVFGADMKVSLINDGPVTIIIYTKNKE